MTERGDLSPAFSEIGNRSATAGGGVVLAAGIKLVGTIPNFFWPHGSLR